MAQQVASTSWADLDASAGSGWMRDNLLDPWSYFDFKDLFKTGTPAQGRNTPSWVTGNERRLRAYLLLESYYRICARRWVNADTDEERRNRREFGDAALIVEACLSSLLGNDQRIFVEGAIEDTAGENAPQVLQLRKLEEWATKENFQSKIWEAERNAVKLGDSCVCLGWDSRKKRPRLRVYHPSFYFPVLSEEDDGDYPTKVHVAYEFEKEIDKKMVKFVRRITWELVDVTPYRVPWEKDPVDQTCIYSNGIWELGDAKGTVYDFAPEGAEWDEQNLDLGIDFIPVVHIPNFVAGDEHFSISVLSPVAQLVDSLIAGDTDLDASAALTGTPVLGIGGAVLPKNADGTVQSYGPGQVIETGDGKLDMLDTSRSLDAMLKFEESRLDRLSVNARTPAALLGRVDPSEVQAGIVLTLSMAPHSTMIREMRMVRNLSHSLILKFVSRFYMKEGELSEIFPCELKLGSYLPADKNEVAGIVSQILGSHAASTDTAVRMMIDAGYPVEDIASEIVKIQNENFDAAVKIFEATMDAQAARDYLDLGPAPEGTTVPGQVEHEADVEVDKAENMPAPKPIPGGPGGNNGGPPAKKPAT